MGPINAALKPNGEQIIELGPATVKNAALWHFDSPHLYEAAVELNSLSGRHQLIKHFGIRKFELRGPAFYLNEEKVSQMTNRSCSSLKGILTATSLLVFDQDRAPVLRSDEVLEFINRADCQSKGPSD